MIDHSKAHMCVNHLLLFLWLSETLLEPVKEIANLLYHRIHTLLLYPYFTQKQGILTRRMKTKRAIQYIFQFKI